MDKEAAATLHGWMRRMFRYRRILTLLAVVVVVAVTLGLAPFSANSGYSGYSDARARSLALNSQTRWTTLALSATELDKNCLAFAQAAAAETPAPSHVGEPDSSDIPSTIHFLFYNARFEPPHIRYLCALESAARHNQQHTVLLHARDPVAFHTATRAWRASLPSAIRARIRIEALDFPRTFSDTPLEPWHAQQTHLQSKWVDQNLGNAFRLAVVYKRGGVYLDLDIISVNALSARGVLGRSLAMQDKDAMNNAFLAFPSGDAFVWVAMEEFVHGFNGNVWGKNGPEVITRTYKKRCKKDPQPFCEGLSIAPVQRFYPFGYKQKHVMFEDWRTQCDVMQRMANESVGMHWWNRRAKSVEVMSNATVLAVVMKAHCPALFGAYLESELGMNADASFGAPELIVEDPELMKPKPSPKGSDKDQKA
ncbi:nucleotide-diphospho-sugar transferase [Chytriomyces sp. MP71]|nr:nucleotide-diphospho-sugar transferase [Chytriomyces sp. MP71]